jgi:plasmid stability protein
MANLIIHDLDDSVEHRLRKRAARHGRSVEEEVRDILALAVEVDGPPRNLASAIRARIAPLGGVDLDSPHREPMPEAPRFD